MARLHVVIAMFVVLLGLCLAPNVQAQTVLFDNGHGERFTIAGNGPLQLSGLADIVRGAGAKVAGLDQPLSDQTLSGVDGLVISGAFRPLTDQEVEAVVRFMEKGGRLAVMLHIAPPLSSLLDRLRVVYTNGVIRENENIIAGNPLDFRSTRIGKHPAFEGIKEFSLYGVWGVKNYDESSRIVAATSPKAWIDVTGQGVQRPELTDSFGVVVAGDVGKGGFLIFGDDAIFQNKFLDANNRALAARLAAWLK